MARYHFVVPSPADTDAEDDASSQPAWLPSRLESPAHLLHATLHANGFGHLVRVNGVEGGALGVTGAQLMGTWDSLARSLRARVVSVEDVSNKGGMELRVLIPAARRATWYGRWGYGYGRAPYGGTRAAWRAATSAAAGAPLPPLAAGLRAAAGGGDALARDAGRVLKRLERVVATATARGTSKTAPPPRTVPTLGALLDGALGLLARPDALAAALAAPAPGVVRSGGGAAGARAAAPAAPAARPPSGGPARPPPPAPTVPAAVTATHPDALPPMPGAVPGAPRALRVALPPLDLRADFPARVPAAASTAALAAVLAVLRELTPVAGGWVARAVVRDAALNSLDRAAAAAVDGALAAVGGRAVGGASVHRSTHPTTRALHYWYEEAGRGGGASSGGGGGGTNSNGGAPATPRAAPRRGAPPPTPPPARKGAVGGDAKRKGVANGGGAPPPAKKGKATTKAAAEPPPTKPPRGSRELASLHADAAGEALLLPPGARRARGPGVAAAPPTTATGAAPRPPPPWVGYVPGAGVPPGGDAAGQLLRDVACLYDALLRPVPLGTPTTTTTKLTPRAAALSALAAAVRVLADTRHFAKDYGGQLAARPTAGAPPTKDARDRWLITVAFADPLPGVGSKGRARRTAPPPLPLLARKGAAVAGLRDAVRRELASVYRLFAPPATVIAVVKGEVTAAGGGGGGSSASTTPPSAKPLTAMVAAANPDPRWRHAGGVEDWAVACACGVRDDDGARMVTCSACGRWVHTRCEGVADTETPPAGLVCVTCCAKGMA